MCCDVGIWLLLEQRIHQGHFSDVILCVLSDDLRFGPGQHHGPPDKGFFVFTQVAGKGEQLVQPDLSQFKPKN